MSKMKALLIKTDTTHDGYDSYDTEIEVTEIVTVDQIMDFIKETFGLDNFLKIALTTEPVKKGKYSDINYKAKLVSDALDSLGFRNIEKIKDIAEKVIAENRYYLYNGVYITSEIDLENLKHNNIQTLVRPNSILLQKVSVQTLKKTHPSAHRKLRAYKKKEVEKQEKRKENAEKTKVAKAKKKLAAAQKVLKEAGESV